MKRQVCVLTAALLAGGCSSAATRKAFSVAAEAPPEVVLRVSVAEERNSIRLVRLEEYVAGTAISEVAPPSGDEEVIEQMLEVQAVVARTYAFANRKRHAADGFDLCSTTHCQLYQPSRLKTSRWAAAGLTATARTAGEVLWHGQQPAHALFHADCGGHTSSAVRVWGGAPRPYMPARPDDDLDETVHVSWRYETSVDDLRKVLNSSDRVSVGSRLETVEVLDRDESGRAATLALHGARERLVRGEAFRSLMVKALGPRSIRSTLFSVRRTGRTFVFEGRGYGHGVGLCQAGALARIKAGVAPRAVLERYFPQTIVRSLGH